MKYIVGCSFGKDSCATLFQAAKKGIKIDEAIYCEVMFDETTSGEHPEHRNFIYEHAIPKIESWGIPVRILPSSKTYIDCFYHVVKRSKYPDIVGKYKGFPLTGRCYVQDRCKARTLDKYKKSLTDYIQYVGITADEPERLKKLKKNQISLLWQDGLTQEDTYKICKTEGLLSPIYEFSNRGGCWFCPNSKDKELLYLKKHYPELWQKLIELGREEKVATRRFNRTDTMAELCQRLDAI